MDKKLMPLAGGMLLAALFIGGACGRESGKERALDFESYEWSKITAGADADSLALAIDGYSGRWQCSGRGVLPVNLGGKDVSVLRDTLAQLAGIEIGKKGEVAMRIPSEMRPLENANDTLPARSRLVKNLSLNLLTPDVAVFRIYSYSYSEGAAHGVYANTYLNYDLAQGNVVTFADLFGITHDDAILAAIADHLDEAGVERFDFNDADDDAADASSARRLPLPTTFCITDTGVDFMYGIYTIAPYAAGEPRVSFNAYELADWLTPAGRRLLGVETTE